MDWFGSLPDELLCHILSFLTTKEAALTSVLSKRWLKLWTFVPNLDIDDSAFLHPEEGKREREGILQSFMDFVDRVLNQQGDYPIKKFSLKCKTGIDTDRVDRWITNVLRRGVCVSDIDLFMDIDDLDFDSDSDSDDEYYRLPQKLFVSSTLVKMKLRSKSRLLLWPGGTFLPMLKTLIITAEWIVCGSLEMLLPRFPVLEELCIAITEWIDCDETVSSPSLRKLTIYSKSCAGLLNSKSISFDTPNLLYLEYSDFVAEDYPKVNLTNLVEAQFNLMVVEDQLMQIRAPNNENDEDDVFLLLGNVSKLFGGIRTVQKLYLSEDTLEVLSLCCESMPVFNNLKYLRITSDEDRGWQAMPVLLRNCPHLETLVLEGLLHYVTDKCGDACDCISREDIGSSLLSCPVKKVQIKGFKGTMRESRMIRHFMESFPCLKEMELYADELDNTTIFETPGMMKVVAQMLFKEFASSDVKFSMYTPIDKKWIQHNDEPFKARSSSPVEDLGVAFSNIK